MPHTHEHELTDEEIFCLQGCRSYQQYFKMRRGFAAGKCMFCQLDRGFNKVLGEDELVFAWLVPGDYLREEIRYHSLIVPKQHVRFVAELTNKQALSVHRAKRYLDREHGYQGGLWHAREGDMRYNAGTVPHLHYNTFEPNMTGEVRVPVYKDPGDRIENEARAAEFAARYEYGELP